VKIMVMLVFWPVCGRELNEPSRSRKVVWEGSINWATTPLSLSKARSDGMTMQIPWALGAGETGQADITTRAIQTLAGDGHTAELNLAV